MTKNIRCFVSAAFLRVLRYRLNADPYVLHLLSSIRCKLIQCKANRISPLNYPSLAANYYSSRSRRLCFYSYQCDQMVEFIVAQFFTKVAPPPKKDTAVIT